MSYAIIRGKGGRRHEVDFGESPLRVEIYSGEDSIEIFVEADFETLPEHHCRFVISRIQKRSLAKRQVRPQADP
jgi:hypothetical protein